MSSIHTSEMRSSAAKRTGAGAAGRDSDLADQLDAIRADIEALTSTVTRIANRQLSRAQDKVVETAREAEDVLRRNPLAAVAIAVGLGFLFGVFTRR
jgi:ElaB/YqjD/DUF883 family membrane-anchored ribosome-binding protein